MTAPALGSHAVGLVLLGALAIAIGWAIGRLALTRRSSFLRPWVAPVRVIAGAFVAIVWANWAWPEHRVGLAMSVLALALAGLPWLSELVHALVFAIERRYRIGDDLRVGSVRGRLIATTSRAVVLRSTEGTEIAVPYSVLAKEQVVRLNSEAGNAPCELLLDTPRWIDMGLLLAHARTAVVLSPYAAPRVEARVIAESGQVRVIGCVFDRDYEALYRSDVGTRFARLLRADASEQPRKAEQPVHRPDGK